MVDRLGFVPSPGSKLPVQSGSDATMLDPLKGGDVCKWVSEQANLIRAGRYREVDWVNVADEIESVGTSEFRSLVSGLAVLLTHMLKWDHQAGKRSRSWVNTIREHRLQIGYDLSDSPSMGSRRDEAVRRGYEFARNGASSETNLPLAAFPPECPYDWVAIMDRPFALDPDDEAS